LQKHHTLVTRKYEDVLGGEKIKMQEEKKNTKIVLSF
jgi:hypothetical protein